MSHQRSAIDSETRSPDQASNVTIGLYVVAVAASNFEISSVRRTRLGLSDCDGERSSPRRIPVITRTDGRIVAKLTHLRALQPSWQPLCNPFPVARPHRRFLEAE